MTDVTEKELQTLEDFNLELTPGSVKKAMSELGASSGDLWKTRPQDIKVLPGFNPRIRTAKLDAKIRWLADQMKEFGFYPDKPLAGYVAVENGSNVLYLQDGHGRLEAALLAISEGADINTVPFLAKDRSSDAKDLTVALVASNEGEPFTPMEKSILVKRFRVFGSSDTEIAKAMRCSPAYVGQLATLAGAPMRIKNMVIAEQVSATNAIEAIRKHGDKAADVLSAALEKAQASGKTKASAKDDATSALTSRQKKYGPSLYSAVIALLEHSETVIPTALQKDLDDLLFRIEQEDVKQVVAKKGEALL